MYLLSLAFRQISLKNVRLVHELSYMPALRLSKGVTFRTEGIITKSHLAEALSHHALRSAASPNLWLVEAFASLQIACVAGREILVHPEICAFRKCLSSH
jgi:hypothetical protein